MVIKMRKGFTLLELLIVVIIIGILASLAIPRYQKATEASKGAEAYNNLSTIRAGTWANYATTTIFVNGDNGTYGGNTTNYSTLKIEDPNAIPSGRFWYRTYIDTGVNAPFYIGARRKDGTYGGDYIYMSANGQIDDTSDWLTGPSGGGSGTPVFD